MAENEFSAVYITVPSQEVGEQIGSHLVTEKLAACVNIIPGVTSIYSWEGEICKDPELILMIKTQTSIIPRLTEAVNKIHPYDCCEVIASPIYPGNEQYFQWIRDSTN